MSDRLDYDEPADDIDALPDGWAEQAALSAEIELLTGRLRDAYTAEYGEPPDDIDALPDRLADYEALSAEIALLTERLRDAYTAGDGEAADALTAEIVAATGDRMALDMELFGAPLNRAAAVIAALLREQVFETAPAISCRMVAAARESLRRTTDHRERDALRRILPALEDLARHAVAYDTARRDPAHPAWTPDPPPEADHRPELVDFEAVAALVESLARLAMPPVSPLLSAAEHRDAAQQTPDPARAAAHLTAAAFAEAAERAALLAAYLAAALRRLDELRAPPEPPPRRRPCVIRGTPAPVVRQPAAPHGPPTRAPRDRSMVEATI